MHRAATATQASRLLFFSAAKGRFGRSEPDRSQERDFRREKVRRRATVGCRHASRHYALPRVSHVGNDRESSDGNHVAVYLGQALIKVAVGVGAVGMSAAHCTTGSNSRSNARGWSVILLRYPPAQSQTIASCVAIDTYVRARPSVAVTYMERNQ